MYFPGWLISLNIILSRSILTVAKGKSSFFFYCCVILHCVNVPQLFIYSYTDGKFAYSHILAIVNSTAMNIGVHIFFCIVFSGFLEYIPRSGIAGSKVSSVFNFFQDTPSSFPLWLHQLAFPPAMHEHSLFSPTCQHLFFVDILLVAILAGVR